jgi:hypothetical protein
MFSKDSSDFSSPIKRRKNIIQEMSASSSDIETIEKQDTETSLESIIEPSFEDTLKESIYAIKLDLPPKPKPSNTVVVAHLNCQIDYENLFWLLPTIVNENELPFEASKRAKYNRFGYPGTILSLRCDGKHRGIFKKIEKERKKDMKHCLEIDMSIKTKNVNFRLYENKIHVVGVSNHDMIKEIVYLLNEHVTEIQNNLIYLQDNPKIIEDFILACKGEKIQRPRGKDIYYQLILPELKDSALNVYTAPFYLHRSVNNWEAYVKFINYINNLNNIYIGDITLSGIHDVVANYCYNLGFTINRSALARLAKGRYGFCSEYDKSKKKEVILSLSIDEEKLQDRPFKESDREPCHTFTIKRKGNVTQKGPSQVLCCEAYDIFCKLIYKIKEDIEK